MLQVLIENGDARIALVDMQILTIMTNPKTGKHVVFAANAKGVLAEPVITEGATITIHVDKPKEPNKYFKA